MSSRDLDDAFAQVQAAVDAYGPNWWSGNDDALAAGRRSPERLAEAERRRAALWVVETAVFYQEGGGSWTTPRPRIHRAIVEQLIRASGHVDDPVLAVTMGVPGSGKTAVLRPLVAQSIGANIEVVDADAVRGILPEYSDGLGSEVVQTETAYIAYGDLFHRAARAGAHVIVDTIGRIDHLREYRSALPRYRLHVLCTEVSIDLAVERTKRRAIASGRFVREQVVRGAGRRPRETFDQAVSEGLADEWALVDTSTDRPVVRSCSAVYGPVGRAL